MSRSFFRRLEALRPKVRLTAVADVEVDRAREAAAGFPGVKVADDFRKILGETDALLLVLPHHEHYPVAKAGLEAGQHVLLEKPMANSEAECLDLIETAGKARRVLMIAYIMRYNPLVRRLKELLDAKTYGEVFQLSIWTEQYTRYPEGHWALEASKLGGGQLFSHGCHYIDLLLWFLGQPVEGTHLGTNLGTPWMEKEGTSHVTLRFANGALGYHAGTWGARGSRLRASIHAHCTGGMLEADLREGVLRVLRNPHIDGLLGPEEVKAARESGATSQEEILLRDDPGKRAELEVSHFADCILQNRNPETGGPEALQSLRVIWRLYEAEQAGRVADLRGLEL